MFGDCQILSSKSDYQINDNVKSVEHVMKVIEKV